MKYRLVEGDTLIKDKIGPIPSTLDWKAQDWLFVNGCWLFVISLGLSYELLVGIVVAAIPNPSPRA